MVSGPVAAHAPESAEPAREHADHSRDRRSDTSARRLLTPSAHWSLTSGAIQAKLAVGSAGDPYEREADRIAEEVIRVPTPTAAGVAGASPSRRMAGFPDGGPERRTRAGPEHGQPLPAQEREFMESRFGYSFDAVRVHTGAAADETATALGARAFTLGHEVVFAAGNYLPGTTAGRRLLAHELAHVVQQGHARGGRGSKGSKGAALSQAPRLVQRWEGLEHRTVGNRAQNEFPFLGTIMTDMTALRATARKDPGAPHDNTKADILRGATVLVLGSERGWLQVVIESGKAQDKRGSIVSADTMTGYISHELVTKSGAIFDAELPMGGDLKLSYGDLVAFGGDHFKDWAELHAEASSAEGRERLKKLQHLTENEATLKPAYEDADTISQEYADRYKNLALENVAHFSGGGTALETWQKVHRQAVLEALEAGKHGDSGALGGAYAVNAFGDHYLTDSFSSGHIRTPREQTIIFYKKLASDVFQHIINYVSARLGNRIFNLLENDYLSVAMFGDEGDRQAAIDGVRTSVMKQVADAGGTAKVAEQFGLYLAGAVSKIMHDRENTLGLKVVSVRHLEGWTAYGDGQLEKPENATNLRYMTEAVQASKQDLLTAFTIGATVLNKHGKTPSQPVVDAAMAELTKKAGPPFAALQFVPVPAPGVPPLPSWEWGKLDKSVQSELLALIARYLTTTAQNELLAKFPARQPVPGHDMVARPRDAARDILNDFLAHPIPFLERAFGRPVDAGP
jgi:hypothetical protein